MKLNMRQFSLKKPPYKGAPCKAAGFTLVEMMVVIAISSLLAVTIVINFRSAATNTSARQQAAAALVADLRSAQSRALSGTQFQGSAVCGFGLHYLSSDSYLIYVRPTESSGQCSGNNRNYQAATDLIFQTKDLIGSGLQMIWEPDQGNQHDDIFFEPPDPRTYINNQTTPGLTTKISIVPLGQNCSGNNCTIITIFTSGRMDVTN